MSLCEKGLKKSQWFHTIYSVGVGKKEARAENPKTVATKVETLYRILARINASWSRYRIAYLDVQRILETLFHVQAKTILARCIRSVLGA